MPFSEQYKAGVQARWGVTAAYAECEKKNLTAAGTAAFVSKAIERCCK